MFKLNDLDTLAEQRVIAPAPLLAAPIEAARSFARWWDAHRQWPGNEPARLKDPR